MTDEILKMMDQQRIYRIKMIVNAEINCKIRRKIGQAKETCLKSSAGKQKNETNMTVLTYLKS